MAVRVMLCPSSMVGVVGVGEPPLRAVLTIASRLLETATTGVEALSVMIKFVVRPPTSDIEGFSTDVLEAAATPVYRALKTKDPVRLLYTRKLYVYGDVPAGVVVAGRYAVAVSVVLWPISRVVLVRWIKAYRAVLTI